MLIALGNSVKVKMNLFPKVSEPAEELLNVLQKT